MKHGCPVRGSHFGNGVPGPGKHRRDSRSREGPSRRVAIMSAHGPVRMKTSIDESIPHGVPYSRSGDGNCRCSKHPKHGTIQSNIREVTDYPVDLAMFQVLHVMPMKKDDDDATDDI